MQAAFEKKFFQADKAIYLGGISADPERPGFERSIIKPVIPKALKFVDASHQSMYGKIATSWKRTGQQLSPRVTVPPNTTALVYVPSSDGSVTESGKAAEKAAGVKFLRREGQAAVFEVGSGDYAFQSSL